MYSEFIFRKLKLQNFWAVNNRYDCGADCFPGDSQLQN